MENAGRSDLGGEGGERCPLAAKALASGLQSQPGTQENMWQPFGVSAPKEPLELKKQFVSVSSTQ